MHERGSINQHYWFTGGPQSRQVVNLARIRALRKGNVSRIESHARGGACWVCEEYPQSAILLNQLHCKKDIMMDLDVVFAAGTR